MEPFRVFIGYDSKEPAAYHVLAHSIIRRARRPVSITPLCQPALRAAGLYTRERGATESTEFSLTRFLVPALCSYKGYALFLDCDMLCLADVHDVMLYAMAYQDRAVYVAQHDYVPKSAEKFNGHVQTVYPRKNWSSVMLFDCALCKALTPDYVNTAPGLALHRFKWLLDELVGALPLEWNWLVGEYEPNVHAKLLHYTLGGPWFADTRQCDHADLWLAERDAMLAVAVTA